MQYHFSLCKKHRLLNLEPEIRLQEYCKRQLIANKPEMRFPKVKTLLTQIFIVIRYKVYSEQHARAGPNIQHVIYKQLTRAGQNT